MNDRELLELAAKAAGYPPEWKGQVKVICDAPIYEREWNPLTDDGDALRLANHLCMSIYTGPCQATASTIPGALRGNFFKEDTIHQDQDKAVRRVIVRAAAEVGGNMP